MNTKRLIQLFLADAKRSGALWESLDPAAKKALLQFYLATEKRKDAERKLRRLEQLKPGPN